VEGYQTFGYINSAGENSAYKLEPQTWFVKVIKSMYSWTDEYWQLNNCLRFSFWLWRYLELLRFLPFQENILELAIIEGTYILFVYLKEINNGDKYH
jgi:hypothetical protein